MKYFLVGDSWATKGFAEYNHKIFTTFPLPNDIRFTDFFDMKYQSHCRGGEGNLTLLNDLKEKIKIDKDIPIIWVYTEPGRDYGLFYNRPQHEWITREDFFDIRTELSLNVLKKIRQGLKNEIGLIGGLSDIPEEAKNLGFTILEYSWQKQISIYCNCKKFMLGWGAGDIGWRNKVNNIKPSKIVLDYCLKQLAVWHDWQKKKQMFGIHPSPEAHIHLSKKIKKNVEQWLNQVKN